MNLCHLLTTVTAFYTIETGHVLIFLFSGIKEPSCLLQHYLSSNIHLNMKCKLKFYNGYKTALVLVLKLKVILKRFIMYDKFIQCMKNVCKNFTFYNIIKG